MGLTNLHFVVNNATLNYAINFENESLATAPVQELVVVDYLDPNLDWTTFAFNAIAYGDQVLSIDAGAGVLDYQTRDFPPASVVVGKADGELAIDIHASLNILTGRVDWVLKVIDTATGDFPTDPFAGFLPPEDGSGRGQGYVSYSIRPKSNLAFGTQIKNKASIIFDTNLPLATNEVSNVVGKAVDLVLLGNTPTQASVGQSVEMTFTVINDGPDDATGIQFTYSVPQDAVLVSITPGQGKCQGTSCDLGTLNHGARSQVIVVTKAAKAGVLQSSATISTSSLELNSLDNHVEAATQVTGTEQTNVYLPIIQRGANPPRAANVRHGAVQPDMYLPIIQR